jgi:hypothetical protein
MFSLFRYHGVQMRLLAYAAGLFVATAFVSTLAIGCGGSGGGGGAGGAAGASGGAGAGGIAGGGGGAVVDSGTDGSQLADCAGLICGSDQQVVKVTSAAFGPTQCVCASRPSTGLCTDCTCGLSICAKYDANCTGFALETGLLCTQPG